MRSEFSLFDYFSGVDVRVISVLSFIVPCLIRGVPEVLMGGYISGFDTISYYIPVTLKWVNDGFGFFDLMASAPLFYVLLVQLVQVGVPFAVSLKVLPPVLLGLLGFVVFVYARRVLSWSSEKSLFVSFLATLYFVVLRISWDMLRSELGLILLFSVLLFLHANWESDWRKCCFLLLPTMVLVVLAHQLVAVIMFAVVFAWFVRKMAGGEHRIACRLILCLLPAALLFGITVYANFVVSPEFSMISSFPSRDFGGWFSLFGFSSYTEMLASSLGFLVYCYLPLFLFVLVGMRRLRSPELDVWFCWCLLAALSSVFSPYAFFVGGYRWTLLLVFPMVFFAIEGFSRFGSGLWKVILGGVLVLLSLSFVLLPAEVAFPYFRVYQYYVPSSMLQNTVSLGDCDDVVNALLWVDDNGVSDGVLLVHDAFHGWALLFIDRSQVVCYGYRDPEEYAQEMVVNGYGHLYLVWWVSGEGWHGISTLPSSFSEVFRSNRIAVYEFSPKV